MKKEVILFTILTLLFLTLIIAEENTQSPPSGDNSIETSSGATEAQTIEYSEEYTDVSQHFNNLNGGSVKVRGLTEDESMTVQRLEDGRARVTISGNGEVVFYDKDGKEMKKYSGFKSVDELNNELYFDENNKLTEGTKVTANGGEDKKGTIFRIGNKDHVLDDGSKVTITKKDDKLNYDIEPDKKITHPKDVKDSGTKDSEDKITINYKIPNGKSIVYEDLRGQELTIKGIDKEGNFPYIQDGDDGYFNIDRDSSLNIGGNEYIGKEDQAKYTRFETDSSKSIPEDYKGAITIADKEKKILSVGTNNKESSSIINVGLENEIIKLPKIDDFKRVLAVQAKGSEDELSSVMISQEDADKPFEIHIKGSGAGADLDDFHLHIAKDNKNNRWDLFLDPKGSRLVDGKNSWTYPSRVKYYNDKGEPINDLGLDLFVDGYKRTANIPTDLSVGSGKDVYKIKSDVKDFYVAPFKMEYNVLHPELQEVIGNVIEEKGITYQQFEKDGFFTMKPGKQVEYIENIPGYEKYFSGGGEVNPEESEKPPTEENEEEQTGQTAEDKQRFAEIKAYLEKKGFMVLLQNADPETYKKFNDKYFGPNAYGSFEEFKKELSEIKGGVLMEALKNYDNQMYVKYFGENPYKTPSSYSKMLQYINGLQSTGPREPSQWQIDNAKDLGGIDIDEYRAKFGPVENEPINPSKHKYLAVLVSGYHCPPCNEFYRRGYLKALAGDPQLENIYFAPLDGMDNQKFAQDYNANEFPTIAVIDISSGKLIGSMSVNGGTAESVKANLQQLLK